ncbi:MAG: YfhO family protein [Acutalibacteraceae bacterium]|nr:YfhO family protein [Acutalibacteraceae bacterium]
MRSVNKTLKKRNSRLARFVDNNIYVALAFLCSTVLMLLVYYCYEIIPFGGRTVLRMDLFHQYGPLFAEFYDRITEGKSLLYSWTSGGGGSFLGNYYNYLSSPIGAVIALIAGHENIPEAVGAMVLIKNALAASTFAFYLKKSTKRNDFTISAFGLLYAFCGFFIAYYWNIMWIDAMYLLPLTILGIENIIKERKCILYIVSLAVAFFSNYYMAYMICIFAVIYFIVYYISKNSFKDSYHDIPTRINEDGQQESSLLNKFLYNRFLRSGVLFASSSIIAALLTAFALIPTYFCLKACSATSGTFPTDPIYYNTIFDFIANHLAALEPTIRSSGDTVLPNVYCGVLAVILLPLYAFCNKISAKEKTAHIVLLAIFFVGFNLNYANYILHALHFPNDLPFRFSFIYSFFILKMAYQVILHIKSISAKGIVGSGLGVLLFTILVQEIGMGNVDNDTVYITVGFTAAYTLILGLMKKKDIAQSAVALLLMCCVFSEVALADIDHIKITQEKVNFVNDYDDFRALKKTLDKKEESDDYRMELTWSNTIMDPSWFNYNGLSVFSSMAYEKSANLQDKLGMDSNYINSYIYYSQTPVYNAMMSLKYLVKNDERNINTDLYEFVANCGKYTAYENKYYMPLAYTVNDKMIDFNYDYSNPFDVHNDFWYYSTGIYGVLKAIDVQEYYTENISDNGTDFYNNSFSYFKEITDADGKITLQYYIPESQNVYLFFKGSTIENIDVYTESSGFSTVQNLSEPYILDCGKCSPGEILTVEVPIPTGKDSGYIECYVAGLDMDILDAGYEVLKQGALNITEFDETYIKGTVDVSENKMLYTSINYDEGWTVKVDGKEAEKVKIGDALIGINLDEGNHEIEFKYEPQGLRIGIIISAATLILLILFILIRFILNKRNNPDRPKPNKNQTITNEDQGPTGIDKMMAEDLGSDATVEEAEALLEPIDEYENQLENNAPTLSKADELLHSQKLDLNAILNGLKENENTDKE